MTFVTVGGNRGGFRHKPQQNAFKVQVILSILGGWWWGLVRSRFCHIKPSKAFKETKKNYGISQSP